ncbi:NUDIX hydrolase [Ureibacillus sinduriensis]|uniref:ADP-ribose pyrophosphatase n=1 Tax=Ureibacillus sinduriensis BLB-1 = JCM 15800 TaxID=1384057 RepID=A0A0A3HUM7_9BACL|nr:NUDIX hydrolase [Ureibacillus sinduriensis]KGR76266.1 ADP-ribose pyrophosphatase [Ureibacillus sinduriensis BLB-1 = JCM 15800]
MGYIMELRKAVGSRPLIMVGACVIVTDKENKVLLQLRQDNDCWGLPGGSLELGESLEQVAKRELLEETGLIADNLTLLNVYSGEEFYYKYPHGDEVYNVVTAYICKEYHGDLRKEDSEVQALKFFNLNNLPSNISPPDFPILTEFIQYLNSEC